jgi:hypothetical protein
MDKRSQKLASQVLNPLDEAIGMRLAYWAYEHKDIKEAEKVAKYPKAWKPAEPGKELPGEWPAANQDSEGRLLPGSPEGWNTQHNANGALENQFKVSINTETRQITFDFKGSDAWSNWKSDLGNAGASEFAKIQAKAQAAFEYLRQHPDYKGYSFTATGHSLGGGMAQSFALKNNIDVYAYNSLPIARDTIQGDYFRDLGGYEAALARYRASGRQVHDVRTPNDIATYYYDHVGRNQYLSDHVPPGVTMLPGSSLPLAVKSALLLSGSGTLVAGAVMGQDHANKALFDAQSALSVGSNGRYRIPKGHAAFANVPPQARRLFAELNASPVTKTLCTDVHSKDIPVDRFHVQHEDGSQERIAVNVRTGATEIDHYDKHGRRTLIQMNVRREIPAQVTRFGPDGRPIETEQVAMAAPGQAVDAEPTRVADAASRGSSVAALTLAQESVFEMAVTQVGGPLQAQGLRPEEVARVCAAAVSHCARLNQGEPERFMVSRDGLRLGVLHQGQVLSEMPIASALARDAQDHLADATEAVQRVQDVSARQVALGELAPSNERSGAVMA